MFKKIIYTALSLSFSTATTAQETAVLHTPITPFIKSCFEESTKAVLDIPDATVKWYDGKFFLGTTLKLIVEFEEAGFRTAGTFDLTFNQDGLSRIITQMGLAYTTAPKADAKAQNIMYYQSDEQHTENSVTHSPDDVGRALSQNAIENRQPLVEVAETCITLAQG